MDNNVGIDKYHRNLVGRDKLCIIGFKDPSLTRGITKMTRNTVRKYPFFSQTSQPEKSEAHSVSVWFLLLVCRPNIRRFGTEGTRENSQAHKIKLN